MSRPLLFVVLLTWAVAARGEWKVIAPTSGPVPGMSYDAARTRYEPPYLTAWTRVSLSAPATLSNGVQYLSALQKVAVDCTAKTWSITYSEFFTARDASGAAVFFYSVPREEWALRPARAGSNGARLLDVLCAIPRPW